MSSRPAQTPEAAQALFQRLLDDWAEAIVANDPERIGAFATPQWHIVDTGGIGTLSKFLDVVRSGDLTHDTMTFKVLSVQFHDDVAVVIAHGKNTGHWQGQAFETDEWTTEVFVRRDDQWLCAVTALTPRR